MNAFLSLIFLNLYIVSVYSSEALAPPEEPPAKYIGYPGCYLSHLDIVLPVDIPFSPKKGDKYECVQYLCGSGGWTDVFACSPFDAPDKCSVVQDFSKPYPDCCPTIGHC